LKFEKLSIETSMPKINKIIDIILLNIIGSKLVILIVIVVWKIFYENSQMINVYFKMNKNANNMNMECDMEWEILTDKCYFRKNIAYYYTDLKIIRLGLIRHVNFTHNFQFTIQVNNFTLTNIRTINIDQKCEYNFQYIETDFDSKSTKTIQVKVRDKINNSTTKLISLKIKNYYENDNFKKYAMICGRISYSNDYLKYLDFWIKVLRLSGFDKLTLFNHTSLIESSNFDKKFVDIIQFNCLPNLLINNNNKHFINFNDIENKQNKLLISILFHNVSLNECYLMNKDKYKYIAIFDFDELILPRIAYKNELNESFYVNFNQYPDKIDPMSNRSSKLIPYLDSLQLKSSKLDKKVNIRFEMNNFLKHETMDKIFSKLKYMFKRNLTKYAINQSEIFTFDNEFSKMYKMLNSFIFIETAKDYNYAKKLYKMHKKYIEPYLEKYNNKIKQSVPEIFNRFYYFTGFRSDSYFVNKTIHYTNQSDLVGVHVPTNIETKDSIIVSNKYGHLSHFREFYRRPFKNSSIREIYFDFNYFNNYFKQILENNS